MNLCKERILMMSIIGAKNVTFSCKKSRYKAILKELFCYLLDILEADKIANITLISTYNAFN